MKANLTNGAITLIPENQEDQKALNSFMEFPTLTNSGGFWGLKKNANGTTEIHLMEQHNRSHKKFEVVAIKPAKKKFEITNF